MTLLYRLKKNPIIIILILMSVSTPCQYAYVYIILTPYEYYTELPALAINAVSNKPGLAASASHTASFI